MTLTTPNESVSSQG